MFQVQMSTVTFVIHWSQKKSAWRLTKNDITGKMTWKNSGFERGFKPMNVAFKVFRDCYLLFPDSAVMEEPSKKHSLLWSTFQQKCQNECRIVLPFSHWSTLHEIKPTSQNFQQEHT